MMNILSITQSGYTQMQSQIAKAQGASPVKGYRLYGGDDDWFDPLWNCHIRPSGVAVLNVPGPILSHGLFNWLIGWDQIQEALLWIVAEAFKQNARALVIRIDSPGGYCAGSTETYQMIRAVREIIPVITVADHCACSAAAGILAQGSEVFVSPDSTTGNIGAWSLHFDISAHLKNDGIDARYYTSGPYKTYFASEVPRTTEADEVFQAGVDVASANLFSEVAAGRGLTPQQIAGMGGMTYHGLSAIQAGIATGEATLGAVLAALEG